MVLNQTGLAITKNWSGNSNSGQKLNACVGQHILELSPYSFMQLQTHLFSDAHDPLRKSMLSIDKFGYF